MTVRAVITGASAGIGEEFARQLHRRGYDVLLVARRKDRLAALCDRFNEQRSGSAAYQVVDLEAADSNEFRALEEHLRSAEIDLLVNNAGFGSFGEFQTLTLADEIRMVQLNVLAGTRLSHAALSAMKERRKGGLIIVSSIAGFQALPYMATYSATKAFNLHQGLSLHYEMKPYGINVLTVCPGPVATEFAGVARVPGTASGGPRNSAEAVVKESLKALDRGAPMVVPCWWAKLLTLGPRIFPRPLATWLVGWMLRGVLHRVQMESET